MSTSLHPFVAWNLRLLQSFFSPAAKGEEVWLATDQDELDDVGPDLGGDAGFLEAVREGPPWNTIESCPDHYIGRGSTADLVQRARGLAKQRASTRRPAGYVDPGVLAPEYAGCAAPSYLPFLAALVRGCAGQLDHGYYSALAQVLGLAPSFNSIQMADLEGVWEDLGQWSASDNSPFGRFTFRRLGGYRLIGVPRSQSILSRKDTLQLAQIFASVGVQPGQEASDSLLTSIMTTAGAHGSFSTAFRDALNMHAFAGPIKDRLRALIHEWDGTLPEDQALAGQARTTPEAGLALYLQADNSMPWEVALTVARTKDNGRAVLRADETAYRLHFSGAEMAIAKAPPGEGVKVLVTAETADVPMYLTYEDCLDGTSADTGSEVIFRTKCLRTMAWQPGDHAPECGRPVLIERPLPFCGPAYLLSTPANAERTLLFLSRNTLGHQQAPAAGLPPGWRLYCITDCGQLSDAIRAELPDGQAVREQPRVVKLVGGQRVRRAGIQHFFSFDLPDIELDAPEGASLRCDGLGLEEEATGLGATGAVARSTGLRRFRIMLPRGHASSYTIMAVHDSRAIGSVRLRLAPLLGLGTAPPEMVSMDAIGQFRPDRTGAYGATIGEPNAPPAARGGCPLAARGQPLNAPLAREIAACPAGMFMDALAQTGELGFGRARDLLSRLVSNHDFTTISDAVSVLRDLRLHGHIEIEDDAKGRWIRALAVPPQLYTLPYTLPDGDLIAAVSGTLRAAHWVSLASYGEAGVRVLVDSTPAPDIPIVLIRAERLAALQGMARDLGLGLVEEPARRIARWLAPSTVVHSALEGRGVESLGRSPSLLELYIAPTGRFVVQPPAQASSRGLSCELYRLDDRETGRHKLHSLGFQKGNGTRFAFVRDARWGRWLATRAFGQFAHERFGIELATPWPLHYSPDDWGLWIPARLSPPLLVERALVFCSGGPPDRLVLSREPSPVARTGIVGRLQGSNVTIRPLSPVYEGFFGDGATPRSVWLRFRTVPQDVATLIAGKLGCQIAPVHY